jgi:hypothetical protein
MPLTYAPLYCIQWGCQQIEAHKSYTLKVGTVRQLYYCPDCKGYFSETQTTHLVHLKTPISGIGSILQSLNELVFYQSGSAKLLILHVTK